MIDWKAALDSHFGENNWDVNGMPPKDGPIGRDPYVAMSMNRSKRWVGDVTHPASGGLPTLGKRA